MFYRQKINELCYMYVYLGTVQCLCMYYVVKLSVVHVPTCRYDGLAFILAHSTRSRFSSGSSAQILLVGRTNLPFRGRFPTSSMAPPPASVVISGQLQQSKYRRSSILAQSLSQVKGSNYSITQLLRVPQYCPFPAHLNISCVLNYYRRSSLLHLLIFLLSIEQVANHEAPVCIGGHRSRGGPVSQC